MARKRRPRDGCPACFPWRSKAFDDLTYIGAATKADRWMELGRVQRYCRTCERWGWVKRWQETPEDYAECEEREENSDA